MILIKDNVKRELTDKETIKIFLENGWKEVEEQSTKSQPKSKEK